MDKQLTFKRYDVVILFDHMIASTASKDFFLETLKLNDRDNPNYNFIDFGLAKGFHIIDKKISIIFEQQRVRFESQEIEDPKFEILEKYIKPIIERFDDAYQVIGYGFNFDSEQVSENDSGESILKTKLAEFEDVKRINNERLGLIFERENGQLVVTEIVKDLETKKNFVSANFHLERSDVREKKRSEILNEIKTSFPLALEYFKSEIINKLYK